MNNLRKLLVCGIAAIGLVAPVAALAQARQFDLPAQAATRSIPEFARQAGVQIVAPGSKLRGLRTPKLKGTYDVRAALSQLLAGTGLRIVSDSGGVITIGPAQTGAAANPVADRLDRSDPAEDDGSAEIVVTGTNIRGVKMTAAPMIQVKRDDIKKSGYSTTTELFEDLPQNFGSLGAERSGFQPNPRDGASGSNPEGAVGVDLLGLGPESTLVLVNGTRRASGASGRIVNIASIPLASIDRVDILVGGRSANYGSDAIGGVVNFITRRDYDGAEIGAFTSFPTEYSGGERYQLNGVFGIREATGGFIASYDFTKIKALDLVKTGLIGPRSNGTILPQRNDIVRASTAHSGAASGHKQLTPWFEVHGDLNYYRNRGNGVRTELRSAGGTATTYSDQVGNTEYSATIGARFDLGAGWRIEPTSVFSEALNSYDATSFTAPSTTVLTRLDKKSALFSHRIVADGPIGTIAGITPRVAVVGEHRAERYWQNGGNFTVSGSATPTFPAPVRFEREVDSVSGELLVPIEAGILPATERLELSVAGRYDRYSDFGDAFMPQAGIAWSPGAGITFNGTIGRSFRAPSLIELSPTNAALVLRMSDPKTGVAQAPVLIREGENPGLQPERAKSWSAGISYKHPQDRVHASLSYYHVDYRDKIGVPNSAADRTLILQRESRFPGLINRAPTAADVSAILASVTSGTILNGSGVPFSQTAASILSAFPNLVIFDGRRTNLALESTSGLTFDAGLDFETSVGRLSAGINGLYVFDHNAAVSPTTPAIERQNAPGYPSEFRFRASAGWGRGPVDLTAHVNYSKGYPNPVSTPAIVGDFTTVDLTLQVDGSKIGASPLLKGLRFNLTVDNLFDKAPPRFVHISSGVLYDAANADPYGRTVSMRLTKAF